MAYEPTEWKTGDIISAEKMNKLEQAVENGSDISDRLAEDIDVLETRVDNIIAPSGDPSLTEVSDARVGVGGTIYPTLKDRIDGEISQTNERIDDVKSAFTSVSEIKNLYFPISDTTKDITLIYDGKNCTFNGTSPSNIVYSRIPLPAGTYTLILEEISGTATATVDVRYGASSGTSWGIGTTVTFETQTNVFIRANNGTYSNYVLHIAIYKAGEKLTAIDSTARSVSFVSPEMFGAVGNGVINDGLAIRRAMAASSRILMDKTYLISETIEIPENYEIVLNGTIIYTGSESAVIFEGNNSKLIGIGGIESRGKYAIRIDAPVQRIEVALTGKIYCRELGAVAVVFLRAEADESGEINNGITRLNFHDLYLVGGNSETQRAYGIFIDTYGKGFINENAFDRISCMQCSYAVVVRNNSLFRIDNNRFDRIEAENSANQLLIYSTTDSPIAGNRFGFRSDEYTGMTGIFDLANIENNIFAFNKSIKPSIFTSTHNSTPKLYSSSIINNNLIEGVVDSESGSPFAVNPTFKMNGYLPVFNFRGERTVSVEIGSGDIDTSVSPPKFTFNWSNGRNLLPGVETYTIGVSELAIDLNYISDWCNAPLQYLHITNESGCLLSIVNGNSELYAQTLLEPGYYRVFYTANRYGIEIVKL